MSNEIAKTPRAPYYAVIFTSIKEDNILGYSEMAEIMEKLVIEQDGFLGFESANNEIGITVSYWKDLESIKKWKENDQHQVAQRNGKIDWYRNYKVRIAKVEREYGFDRID